MLRHMDTKELITKYEILNGKRWSPNIFYNEALDKLGFTKALSEERAKIYDNASDCLTRVICRNWSDSVNVIVAGSRGEGVAVSVQNDLDMIYVQPAVKCFEDVPMKDPKAIENCEIAFQLDLDNVPEGYTKLLLKHIKPSKSYESIKLNIKAALTKNDYLKNGGRLISAVEYKSNDFKREGWISKNYKWDDVTGPAQPLQLPLPGLSLSLDYVQAFPCAYPSVLDSWFKRERQNTWPSADVLNAVKESDVYVVSVGLSGSKEENLQWRISITLAERALVRSFNDTQIKVYAAMKMLVKHELKPICANITSYIVKNVIFWVFEKRSGSFQRDEFVEILLQTLLYLNDCINVGCLPNYMIPSKNLLQGKVSEIEVSTLNEHLDILIREDSTVLLRCPLLNKMAELREGAIKEMLLYRDLSDKLFLSVYALPPPTFDVIEHKFHLAQSREECVQTYFSHVLPIIKATNPFGAFSLLKEMSDEDITCRIMLGNALGFGDIWLG